MKRILVVVAHLDDETFGIGGSLLKWKDSHDIKIVSLCCGRNKSNSNDRKIAFKKITDKLNCDFKVLPYYDLQLEKESLVDFTNIIAKEINDFNPDIIITNSENDIHQDHKIVSHATKIAARPSRNNNIKEILEFKITGSEPFSSTYFDTVVDISSVILDKNEMCMYYESENMPEIENKEYFKTIYRKLEL